MAEAAYRSDGWDRLRVVLAWVGAALVPLWVLLSVLLLDLRRDPTEAPEIVLYLMPDGSIEERAAGLGWGEILSVVGAAGAVVFAAALVVVPVGWAVSRMRRDPAIDTGPLVLPELVEGGTWEVTITRGGAEGAAPTPAPEVAGPEGEV